MTSLKNTIIKLRGKQMIKENKMVSKASCVHLSFLLFQAPALVSSYSSGLSEPWTFKGKSSEHPSKAQVTYIPWMNCEPQQEF